MTAISEPPAVPMADSTFDVWLATRNDVYNRTYKNPSPHGNATQKFARTNVNHAKRLDVPDVV